jgi:hypothetical protein
MQATQEQVPRILADYQEAGPRYVELSTMFSEEPRWGEAMRQTIATFDGDEVTLTRLSDREPGRLLLSQEEMNALVVGYLTYLVDRRWAVRNEHLVNAFAAYVQASETQQRPAPASIDEDGTLGDLDTHPF